MARKRKRKGGLLKIVVPVILILIVMFAFYKIGLSLFAGSDSLDDVDTSKLTGEVVSVNIPEGASTKDIAEILKEEGLIKNATVFRLRSKINGFDGTYKHGVHEIQVGLDDDAIMLVLQKGALDADQTKVTIPEGYTAYQIAALMEEKGIVTADAFIAAVNSTDYDYDFIQNLPQRKYQLDGYLFPDTYYLKEGITAEEIVDKMLARFNDVYSRFKGEIDGSGKSLDEIITVASIVEAEIKVPEERPRAAGVIYNRLEDGMPLQMCSTVLYSLEIRRENLTLDDLEVDSPYNTYKNSGLPSGPISNPGEAAIEAAVHPEDNKYLYFVLKADADGEHVFTETYDEFLKAKEKYKQQF